MKKQTTRFTTGLVLALVAALMAIFHFGSDSLRITILILGIVFIATSKFKLFK